MPASAAAIMEPDAQSRDYSRFDKAKMPKGGVYGLEVGGRLKHRRLMLGLKQEDVAERSNGAFARVAYTNYENGEVVPGPEKIFALAEALETTAKWLYFGDEGDLIGNVVIHQFCFLGSASKGKWQDAGKTWGLNRDWVAKTFPDTDLDQVVCAVIDNSNTGIISNGEVILVDRDVKPNLNDWDDYVYSAAGSIHVGGMLRVNGGFMVRSKNEGDHRVDRQHIHVLGRAIGQIASLNPAG